MPTHLCPGRSGRNLFQLTYRRLYALTCLAGLLMAGARAGGAAPSPTPTPTPTPQLNGPVTAVKVSCTERGIYKLDGQALRALGVELARIDTEKMALIHYDKSVPLYAAGLEDKRFDPQDAIYFFSEGSMENGIPYINVQKDYYPNTQIFMLYLKPSRFKPLRYKTVDLFTPATPDEARYPTCTVSGRKHFERNDVWEFFDIPNIVKNKTDFLYWAKLTWPASNRTISNFAYEFELPRLDPAHAGQLEAHFYPVSDNYSEVKNHRIMVTLNGTALGDVNWAGKDPCTGKLKIPAGALHAGKNKVEFALQEPPATLGEQKNAKPQTARKGIKIDMVMFDWFNVQFKQASEAVNDYNEFIVDDKDDMKGLTAFSLRNFSARDILVFDLEAQEMLKAVPFAQAQGTPTQYGVNLERPARPTRLVGLSAAKGLKPFRMEPVSLQEQASQPPVCDLLVLTHPAFKRTLEPFVAWKRSRGLTVQVADIFDIFNENTGGYATTEALRDYIRRAYENPAAKQKLKYVLLVGDSSTISKYQTYCPAYAYLQSGTHANDNYYANFENPGAEPKVAVGRFSVRTEAQLQNAIRKVMDYEGGKLAGAWRSRFFLIAAAFDWAKVDANKLLDQYVRPNYYASMVKTDTESTDPDYQEKLTAELVNRFNEGSVVTTFFGHGGGTVWEVGPSIDGAMFRKHLFDQKNVETLTNYDKPSLVFALTCYTCDFDNPHVGQTLGETFVNSRGGAVAVIGATGRSSTSYNSEYVNNIYALLFARKYPRLGDYIVAVKNQMRAQYVNMNYQFLGDPSLEFSLPQADLKLGDIKWTAETGTLAFDYTLPKQVKTPAQLTCRLMDEQENLIAEWTAKAPTRQGRVRNTVKGVRFSDNMRVVASLIDGGTGEHAGAARSVRAAQAAKTKAVQPAAKPGKPGGAKLAKK